MAYPIVGQFAFRHVPFDARQEIADILDPTSVCGLSWLSFADRLNRYFGKKLFFNTTKLNAIGSRQGSPTLEVFEIIASSNVITTDIVQQVLIEMSSAATDVLPRYMNEIAINAGNEAYRKSNQGHHHNCHCHSCIKYCDCHKQCNHQDHYNNGHCGDIGHNRHRRHCSQNHLSIQPDYCSGNGTGNQINGPHYTNPVQMYRDQERLTSSCDFQNNHRSYVQNTRDSHGHQQQRRTQRNAWTGENNDLGHIKNPDFASKNVERYQNIELTEYSSKQPNQHMSSCMTTTSNNLSESVQHSESDSAILQTQNQILNETPLQWVCDQLAQLPGIGTGNDEEPYNVVMDQLQEIANKNCHEWIPPDDSESDSDSSMIEIPSEKLNSGISQSRQRMHEIRQAQQSRKCITEGNDNIQSKFGINNTNENANIQSQSGIDNTKVNDSIQSQSGMDNTHNHSQPQIVPMRNNIQKTSGSHDNAQCTCSQEDQLHSLPVMRPPHPNIRKKCASESDIDRHVGRSQLEENACTCRKQLKIFTSFAVDNTKHLKEVLEMQKTLRNKGYIVRSDMNEGTFQKKMANSHDWLEEEFYSAEYVIFCISPEFYEYIQPDFKESNEAFPANSRLHTRFIFDLARNEYIENGSKNKRFLPVIFTNSGANIDHLPKFMHATIIYYYPETFDRLLSIG